MRWIGALSLITFATSAQAGGLNGHQLDVGLLTDFPVMVGGNVTYEAPFRLRAELNAGAMPGPYVDTINWGMTTFDIYSDEVANLIDVALKNSILLRTEVGYRPFARYGLVVSAGYQFLALSGDTADVQVLTANIDPALVGSVQGATGDIELRVSPHMITGEVGYEWLVKKRLVLRSTLGFAYTVASQTTVRPTQDVGGATEEAAMDAVVVLSEDYLNYVFEEWVHLPMVGIGAAWRFQ